MQSRIPAIEPLLVLTVLTAAFTDYRRQKIYNWLTLPAIVLGLAMNLGLHGLKGLGDASLGFLLGFMLSFGLYALKGIKGVDVKLIAAVGAMGGWKFVLAAMLYTGIAGAILSLWWAAYHGTLRKTMNRFAQMIKVLMIPGMKIERPLDETDSPLLPYGIAIAAGTILRMMFPEWLPL